MTAATYVGNIASRVNEMSLRERALVFAAALGLVALLWDQALMQPLARRELAAQSVLTSLAQPADSAASSGISALDIASARLSDAVQREQTVRLRLNSVNAELGATAADLLPPEKVVQVVRDVLAGQRELELLSLRNMAPLPLVPPDNPRRSAAGTVSASRRNHGGGRLSERSRVPAVASNACPGDSTGAHSISRSTSTRATSCGSRSRRSAPTRSGSESASPSGLSRRPAARRRWCAVTSRTHMRVATAVLLLVATGALARGIACGSHAASRAVSRECQARDHGILRDRGSELADAAGRHRERPRRRGRRRVSAM